MIRVLSYLFANNAQPLLHGPASSAVQMIAHLLETSSALDPWLSSDRLLLNHDKKRFMWLGGGLQLDKIYTKFSSSQF